MPSKSIDLLTTASVRGGEDDVAAGAGVGAGAVAGTEVVTRTGAGAGTEAGTRIEDGAKVGVGEGTGGLSSSFKARESAIVGAGVVRFKK